MSQLVRTHLIARRRGARALAAVTCGASLLFGAAPALAAQSIVPSGAGLSEPTGIARTSDGTLWVADHLRGICQVTPAARPAVVEDPQWCTVLHVGPAAPSGLVFDPVSNSLYTVDAASGSGAVWRFRWDPAVGKITSGAPIQQALNGDRLTAVALVPSAQPAPPPSTDPAAPPAPPIAPDLIYASKRSSAVLRVNDPATDPKPAQAVGFAQAAGVMGLAYLNDTVYLSEATGVTSFPLGGNPRTATPLAGSPALPSAIAADPALNRLYIGTNNGSLQDAVEALDPTTGVVELYDRGFVGVTSLAVGIDNELLVGDDPGAATGALDSADQGRLWRIGRQTLARPSVQIDAAPLPSGREKTATFAYSSATPSSFECRLDGEVWAACPSTGPAAGSITYPVLADGVHRFEVRGLAPGSAEPGVPAGRTFVIDTVAPTVEIVPPSRSGSGGGTFTRGSSITVDLLADEHAVNFRCSIDGGWYAPCDPPHTLSQLSLGDHELSVFGTDAAGNESVARPSWTFTVVPAPPAPPAPPVRRDEDTGGRPTVVMPEPTKPRAVVATRPIALRVQLLSTRVKAAKRGGRVTLRIDATVPAEARSLRIQLHGASPRDPQTVRVLASRALAVKAGVKNALRWQLTAAQSRSVRPGTYLVTFTVRSKDGTSRKAQSRVLRVTR